MFTEIYGVEDSIDFSKYYKYQNILIQIFSGETIEQLQEMSRWLSKGLPQAVVIGATTDGEIANGKVTTKQTVVSISVFEHTALKASSIDGDNSSLNGQILANRLVSNDTKLLLIFSDGLHTNGEELLKGIEKIASDTPVAGGMAGDNAKFKSTAVTLNGAIFTKGVVGVALNSDSLNLITNYNFNWRPIGKTLRITKAYKNIVYTINHIEAGKIYKKYLGSEVYNRLPQTGIEFPLIVKKRGVNIARAVINIDRKDDSLIFAGNIKVGDKVQFGIGNISMILQETIENSKNFVDKGIESFFLYSCMARRRLMPDDIESEVKPFSHIAPTIGFFTNGEFFHKDGYNELLNQTLTFVGLSENRDIQRDINEHSQNKQSIDENESFFTLQALSHLVDVSTDELDTAQEILKDSINYSSSIQKAILPKKELFNDIYRDHFIYWKPRDRVGGDIFFLEKYSDTESILMVFDCVGHGVYGAFITMLVKAIERSIIGTKEKSPSKILQLFNREIKNIISDSNIDIGFDGGVLFLNKESGVIKYAGASTSLFLSKDGVIKEIKGDRTSVGNRFSKVGFKFKEIEIPIEENMQLYISTDGFFDQTGGELGFSYGKKRFKKELENISDLNFEIQRTMLRKSLRVYQKGKHSLDDRTVIGLKL